MNYPAAMINIRISSTIDNEYATRCPDFLPLEKLSEGVVSLTLEEAREVLADAEFNCDPRAQTVGPNDMPLPIFNAYRALAKQTRVAIAKATGEQANEVPA
jgi:hypothetical protein